MRELLMAAVLKFQAGKLEQTSLISILFICLFTFETTF